MRAFPKPIPSTVRLTIDEGALVVGLLDFLVEPTMRASPDVLGLAERTRRRVAGALATAINESTGQVDAIGRCLHDHIVQLQRANELLGVARRAHALMGEAGAVHLDADDARLEVLRADLARVAA